MVGRGVTLTVRFCLTSRLVRGRGRAVLGEVEHWVCVFLPTTLLSKGSWWTCESPVRSTVSKPRHAVANP